MKIFAISGSVRASSSNTALLNDLAAHARPPNEVEVFALLEAIPAFNPDRENEPVPPAVEAFRNGLRDADVVVISTPEYAHGVPGVLKNALDWLVGSGELYRKPVALLQAANRGAFALAHLKDTLAVMDTRLVLEVLVERTSATFAADLKETLAELTAVVTEAQRVAREEV